MLVYLSKRPDVNNAHESVAYIEHSINQDKFEKRILKWEKRKAIREGHK